jgi:nucleotide-binding universal stress UspA family protein
MSQDTKKILVPTDFSKESLGALHYAAAVARKISAEVILLHVMETYEYNVDLDEIEEYVGKQKKVIEKKLDDFRTEHSNLWGVRMHTMLRKGKIHKEIQSIAEEIKARLIIMGTHGASGISNISKYILGSNAYRTVNSSPCPVITIRNINKDVEFNKILLPLDITKRTTAKVDYAIAFAKEFGAEIHVVSVIEFFEEYQKDVDKMRKQLDEVSDKISEAGINCRTALMRNKRDVAKAVMEYAEDQVMDLIIIMTRQETLFNELILGSHSRKIIGQSNIPVLSVRPKKK